MEGLLALAAIRTVGELVSSLVQPSGPAHTSYVPQPVAPRGAFVNPPKARFEDHLQRAEQGTVAPGVGMVRFSDAAGQKLAQLGVQLDPQRLGKIMETVSGLAAQGAEKSIVLMDGLAYVVDVRDRMVVDVMDKNQLGTQQYLGVDSIVEARA